VSKARYEQELAEKFPDLYAEYRKKLAKRGEDADKKYDQDKWMALLETGLGIMGGSSPYALQNIAAGGKQGIASLKAAQEAQAKAKEGIEDKMLQSQVASRADSMKIMEMAANMSEKDFEKTMKRYGLESEQAKTMWEVANKNREYGLKERALASEDAYRQGSLANQRAAIGARSAGSQFTMEDALKSVETSLKNDPLMAMKIPPNQLQQYKVRKAQELYQLMNGGGGAAAPAATGTSFQDQIMAELLRRK
jgi:hypothetical protein